MTGRKWLFKCATKWHEPDDNFPQEPMPRGDTLYFGYVCKHCGCVYFEKQGKVSPILGPGGLAGLEA